MIISLALYLCNAMSCQVYNIDTFAANNMVDCMDELVIRSESFSEVWNSDKLLTEWLENFKIKQDLKLINDYDFVCEMIVDSDIP